MQAVKDTWLLRIQSNYGACAKGGELLEREVQRQTFLKPTNEALIVLLEHPPSRVHQVISTRADLALPLLSRLRGAVR